MEPSEPTHDVTRLLASGADAEALLPLIYDELRDIARGRMQREAQHHTLQPTALVNEAYLRLVGTREMEWRDRRHFYAAAAESMRRVLIDHARKARSEKRGGAMQRVSLLFAERAEEMPAERFLALEEAVQRLESEDPRAAEVTRLRFFGGLEMSQIAAVLELSERSVYREWTFARTRLHELLESEG